MSYIGNDIIGSLCFGSEEIGKAYLGDVLVHESVKPEYRQWVGSDNENNPLRFELNLRWLSTMKFSLDSELTTIMWRPNICTYSKNNNWLDTWVSDKNRWEIINAGSGVLEFLYFSTTSGNKNIENGRHTLAFDGGFLADGVRITTVNNPQSCGVDYRLSICSHKIYGFKVWDNGVLIVNLVPAVYGGEYGMWDAVSGEFYQTKLSSDHLIIGPVVDDKMSLLMSRTIMADNPTAIKIHGNNSEIWAYQVGLLLFAMLRTYDEYNGKEDFSDLLDYALGYYHRRITNKGVTGYNKSDHNSDNVQPGYNLFRLMQLDSSTTYQGYYDTVIDTLASQLAEQSRLTTVGTAHPYQHKDIYAHQHWLDGLFMTQPFRMRYAKTKLTGSAQSAYYDDVVAQLIEAGGVTYDSSTQLHRHAYSEDSSVVWVDHGSVNGGQAYYAWGRGLGWYIMALCEVLDLLPSDHARRDELIAILSNVLVTLQSWKSSGSWRQLPTEIDQTTGAPNDQRNELESSSSCMFTYGYLHGVRMGYLPSSMRSVAKDAYESVLRNFVTVNGSTVTLSNGVIVGNPGKGCSTRAAVLNNYYNTPLAANDLHAVGPFILASLEYEKMF